jgi:uncharacterized protein involved in exopolysaccharide biosynthesis
MSTHPRLEARVSAQERRQTNIEARIEELSEDITASFKQVSEYLGKIETTMATKEDLAAMATKEDLAAMENRILDAFKQMLTMINPQQPPSK